MEQETQPGSSGASTQSAGGGETTPPENQTVAYDTHRKLLGEKKRLEEKYEAEQKQLQALRDEKKQREEQEMRQKGETDKLLKLREDELKAERAEKEQYKSRIEGGIKLQAVLETIGGKVDPKYFIHVPLDEVVIDPATGRPDASSVKLAASKFEQEYPEVIRKGNGAGLPSDAARGGSGSLTYEEWKKLPPKEMKARYHEVYQK